MDRYNLLKNISEGRLGVTTPEYGYTVINDNIGKAYTLDLSVIATVDKCEGKFAAKSLQLKTVSDIKRLPENVLGYYVLEEGNIVRIKKPVKGAYAVCFDFLLDYINFTGAKAVSALLAQINEDISLSDTVFISNDIYPTEIIWSSTLKKAYEEKYHEDMREKLALLFIEAKGSARFRNRYYSLLCEIVYKNFVCQLKGKALIGGTKLALNVFDLLVPGSQVLPSNSLLQYVSAFDKLFLKADEADAALLKVYGGISLQFGSEIIAEISGAQFVNSTLNELKNTVDKLFAVGIKKIGFENIAKYAKFDVLAKKAEYLADYINLIGACLSEGVVVADALVVYSNNTAYGISNPQNRTEEEKFSAFVNGSATSLTECGLAFHLCDERLLKDFAEISGNRIKIGQHSYTKIVLAGADNISFSTANILFDYADKGGKIYALGGKPRLIDGVISERMKKLSDNITQVKIADAASLKLSCEPRIKGLADVRTLKLPDGSFMYLLANISGENPTVTFNTYEDVLQTDLITKSEYALENKNRLGRLTGKSVFALEGASAVLRVVKSGSYSAKRKNAKYVGVDPVFDVTGVTDNCLVINRCQWRTGRNKWQSADPVVAVLRQLSYINKNYSAEFKFAFNIEAGALPSVCKLVIKNADCFNITVNGAAVEPARNNNISGLVREGENTVVIKAAEFNSLMKENPAVLDNVRLLGNFGVKNNAEVKHTDEGIVTENDFTITALPIQVNISEITQSGFWFFGGTIELSQTITIPEKEGVVYKFGFTDFKAQLAEVFVNGISAGLIGFEPFEVPISELLYQGENKITVKLFSGIKNYNILNGSMANKPCFAPFGGKVYDRVMAYVKFSGVTKTYKNGNTVVNALNDVTFGIERGEFVVIFGPDGSGKTTLFNLLAATERCDSGVITVDETVVNELTLREKDSYHRDDVALICAQGNLLPGFTVAENIELAAAIAKEPLDLGLSLAAVGLSGQEKTKASQLDADAQLRTAVARALAKNPKIILCDEPTAQLDTVGAKAILHLLYNVCKNTGKTVIVITNNSAFCSMADRIIKIKDGTITQNIINENPVSAERIEL